MAEHNDEAARVLNLLKGSDEPTAADAERVRRAVWARIGAAGAATALTAVSVQTGSSGGAGLGSSSVGTASLVGAKTAWIVTVAKVGIAATLIGTGGWYGARALSHGVQAPSIVAQKEGPAEPASVTPKQPLATTPALAVVPAGTQLEAVDPSSVNLGAANSIEPRGVQFGAKPAARAANQEDSLSREVALLSEAQQALASGQFATALARLNEHAKRYPRGALASEREAARAIALCRSGETQRGRALATRFVAAHAASPLCARVRAACDLEK